MWAVAAAMTQDFRVVAAGVCQGIGKDWKLLEDVLIVNGTSQAENGGSAPASIEYYRAYGIAEQVA